MRGFSGQPSDICYLGVGDHRMVVGEDLLNGRALFLGIDGARGHSVDIDSVR